jgi:tetratricopeptide (TPR) repeat protein
VASRHRRGLSSGAAAKGPGPRPARGPARPGRTRQRTSPDRRIIDSAHTAISQFAATELKSGERVAGRYRIEALLGVGGMGVVYRAHDEQLGIDVALKLLRPELASRPQAFERFRQELLLSRKVSSPQVVRIHDLVADGGRWLISMDLVEGRSLEQLLDTAGALPPEQALPIARQIAQGLAAAHASGVIHRDLKPANVLVRDDGRVCISDFGVARVAGSDGMTGTGVLVGTPDYVSPEQARGDAVGPRSDLYALGLILYEMLGGQRAFADATPAESLAQRQMRAPMPIRRLRPDIPPWVERLLARLLDPHPLRRLRDAEAVIAAIDTARVPRARPRWTTLAATALVLAAVATGVWGYLHGWRLQPAPANVAAQPVALDLAVLPLRSAPADADLARAYGALIGASVLAGDVPTADGARVRAALRRLGYDPAAAAEHPERVLAELGARRLLTGELRQVEGRWRIQLALTGGEGARSAATADVGLAAMAPALRGALTRLGLVDASGDLGTVYPVDEAALRAFGQGLGAATDVDALAAFERAVAREPRFSAAWWHRLQVARRLLPSRTLGEIAASARDALRGTEGRDALRVRALIALIESDVELAVERLAPLAAADPHDHQTRLLYAEALDAVGRRADAVRELERLTAKDPKNADAWLLRGQTAIRAGEAQSAVDDHLLRARVLYARLGDERGRADALNALGLGFDLLGQARPAIDHFAEAAELRERLRNPRGAASSRRNLAWAHAVAGDHAAAVRDLERARALALPLDDPALLADIANDAGLIAEERGDFREALPYFREALALREAQGDPLGVAETALNLGFALLHTGDFGDAQPYLEQAERTYSAAEDRVGMVHSLQSLAAVDLARGAYASARQRLTRAGALATEVNLAEERAVLYAEQAELARQQGRPDEALALAQRALGLFAGGDARGATETRLRIAAVHRDLEAWDAAEVALQPFAANPPANLEHAALLIVRRGQIALGRGDAARAVDQAEAAIAQATEAHSMPVQIEARLLRVRALAARGDTAAALAELARADAALRQYPAFALRLERALAAIVAQPPAQAARTYREAIAIPGASGYGRAHLLHAAGAQALTRTGDAAAATEAGRRAADARAALRAGSASAAGGFADAGDAVRRREAP